MLFDKEEGVLFLGDKQSFKSLGWNLLGLIVMFLWSLLLSALVFGLLKFVKCTRLSEELEQRGKSKMYHGGWRGFACQYTWERGWVHE